MKIAVYTIALNEEKHVQQWYDTAKDADYLLIADTGSTDKTVKIAKKLGINIIKISISPFRFDDARNAALAALPDDIDMCISLDMDEVLSDGWREKLEGIDNDVTQVIYKYTWSWRDPQSRTQPQTIFLTNKVHARHGYRWNYLVHEIPLPDRNDKHKEDFLEGFEILHYPDINKSREQYSTMIEQALEETDSHPRYWVYQYSNLISAQKHEEAKSLIFEYLKKFKGLLTDEALANAYQRLSLCVPGKEKHYLKKAIHKNPRREYIVLLAVYHFKKGNLRRARNLCIKAMQMTQRKLDAEYLEQAWGYLPKNMLYVCNHNLKISNMFKKIHLNVDTMIASSFDLYKD